MAVKSPKYFLLVIVKASLELVLKLSLTRYLRSFHSHAFCRRSEAVTGDSCALHVYKNSKTKYRRYFEYDTIRYTILTYAKKLMNSQLSLPHGIKQKEQ